MYLAFLFGHRREAEDPVDLAKEIKDSIQKGINYLLKSQENRCWWRISEDGRDYNYTSSITAIASLALLSLDAGSSRSIRAVKKAVSYLSRLRISYSPYAPSRISEPYFIFLLFKSLLRHPEFQKDKGRIKRKMKRIIKYLIRAQKRGAWGFISTESVSTAMALLTLKEAKELGFDIPKGRIKRALRALKRMRRRAGVFTYSSGTAEEKRKDNEKSSIGRGCVCELALFRWGVSTRAELRKVVENFFRYRKSILLRTMKMGRYGLHHGPYNVAPYYFFFAHYFATVAVEELGEEFKKRYFPELTRCLVGLQSKEGWWLDSYQVGKNYGTGIVLLTLARIAQK